MMYHVGKILLKITFFCILIFHLKHVQCEGSGESVAKLARLEKATTLQKCNATFVPYEKSCDECGKTFFNPNPRIVGGVEAIPYSWPAQVFIIQNVKAKYFFERTPGYYITQIVTKQFVCGGTLINRYTVLSAAHCINTEFIHEYLGDDYILQVYTEGNPYYSTQESMFEIYIGAFDIRNLLSVPTVKKSVKRIIKHTSYDPKTFQNDIALFILSTPATLNQYVQPACLPDPSYGTYPPSDMSAFASGWGTTFEGGDVQSKLRNVALNVYSPANCLNVEVLKAKNWLSQICAGNTAGNKDTCQGDSGGGLYVYDTKFKKYVVVGVTSYGEGCGRLNKPGIYTRISYYYDWITRNWATSDSQSIYVTKSPYFFSIALYLIIFSKNFFA